MSDFKIVNSKSLSSGKRSVHLPNFSIVVRIMFIILCAILVTNIIKNLFSGNTVTFTSFLNYITSVPQISANFSMDTIYISGDWAILDGLRVFLNTIMQPLNLLLFLVKNLWNCLLYIVYFVRFLFV